MLRKSTYILLALVCTLSACDDEPTNDLVQSGGIDRNGAVETAISIDHLDDQFDIITTTHKAWVNGAEYRTFVHKDTLPSLGSSVEDVKTKEGNEKTTSIRKDYESYITVK
jgi:hypothetical protein